MNTDGLKLVSVAVCEDMLANPSGRLTLYNLFHDLTADDFPALLPRLHLVTTWYNPAQESAQALVRVLILSPDESLAADAAVTVRVAAGTYHTQVTRFRDLVLPVTGTYRVQVLQQSELLADLPLVVSETVSETQGG